MSANFEKEVILPSKGLLYGDMIKDGKVVIRSMTTAEEKKVLGSPSMDTFNEVIQSCVISPKDLKLSDLITADSMTLMILLRMHTYGSDYHLNLKCEHCDDVREYKIDLEKFEIYYLEDDFAEPLVIPLERSSDVIKARLLRGIDEVEIREKAKRMNKQRNVPLTEASYMLRMAKHIVAINDDDKMLEPDILNYIDNILSLS